MGSVAGPAAGHLPRCMVAPSAGGRRGNQLHAADSLTPPLLSSPSVRPGGWTCEVRPPREVRRLEVGCPAAAAAEGGGGGVGRLFGGRGPNIQGPTEQAGFSEIPRGKFGARRLQSSSTFVLELRSLPASVLPTPSPPPPLPENNGGRGQQEARLSTREWRRKKGEARGEKGNVKEKGEGRRTKRKRRRKRRRRKRRTSRRVGRRSTAQRWERADGGHGHDRLGRERRAVGVQRAGLRRGKRKGACLALRTWLLFFVVPGVAGEPSGASDPGPPSDPRVDIARCIIGPRSVFGCKELYVAVKRERALFLRPRPPYPALPAPAGTLMSIPVLIPPRPPCPGLPSATSSGGCPAESCLPLRLFTSTTVSPPCLPSFILFLFPAQTSNVLRRPRRSLFCVSAFGRDRQKTTLDEKRTPGKVSGIPGTAHGTKVITSEDWVGVRSWPPC